MDPISTIPGLVDAAAFVDLSATASGTKVTVEIVQVLNKVNEVIGGLTVVAGDLDTATGTVSGHTASIAALVAADAAEVAARTAADNALGVLVSSNIARLTAIESDLLPGCREIETGDYTLATATEHVINFSALTGEVQDLNLPAATDFTAGQNWVVFCGNEDGVRIVPASDAVMAQSGGVTATGALSLLNGETAIVSVVLVSGSKRWSVSISRAPVAYTRVVTAADDYVPKRRERFIVYNRFNQTGNKRILLPNLAGDTADLMDGREIFVYVTGTPSDGGTFTARVHTDSAGTMIGANDSTTGLIMATGTAKAFRADATTNTWFVL